MRHFLYLICSLILVFVPDRQALEAEEVQSGPNIDSTVVFFYYEQLEPAAAFYGELLGLPATLDQDWVRIYQITETSSVGLVLQGRGFHNVAEDKPAMLSMVVSNVDAWYERLQAAGVPILKPLPPANTDVAEGAAPVRGFIAEDPGGYTIEFFTWQTPSLNTGKR